MTDHELVSREEWAAAREELLAREKEHTRLGDELARRGANCPGSESRRSTASTQTTAHVRWRSCSTAAGVASSARCTPRASAAVLAYLRR